MTKHLTKSLINLRGFGFASLGNSKPRFDHMKRGFDVGSHVIALPKTFGVVVIQMVIASEHRERFRLRVFRLTPQNRPHLLPNTKVGMDRIILWSRQI